MSAIFFLLFYLGFGGLSYSFAHQNIYFQHSVAAGLLLAFEAMVDSTGGSTSAPAQHEDEKKEFFVAWAQVTHFPHSHI